MWCSIGGITAITHRCHPSTERPPENTEALLGVAPDQYGMADLRAVRNRDDPRKDR